MRLAILLLLFAGTHALAARILKSGGETFFVPTKGEKYTVGEIACADSVCGEVLKVSRRGLARMKMPEASRDPETASSRLQVSLEVFGTGFFYCPFLSYRIGPRFAANFGLTYNFEAFGTVSASRSEIEIPVSVSGLFGGPNHFFEALAGLDPVLGMGTADTSTSTPFGNFSRGPNSALLLQLGVGYRYWPAAGGFHFRALALGTYGSFAGTSGFNPYFGLAAGYAFAHSTKEN